MSLSKKIAAALDENTKAYVLPCTVAVEDGPNRLTLHLTALDAVGLAFTALEFATTSRTEWSSEALKEWGDRLSSRVTYLMEPLKVLEIDAGGGEVQIPARVQPLAPTNEATTRCACSAGTACGWNASPSTRPPASAARPLVSSRVRSWNAWPTTSPPARAEPGRPGGGCFMLRGASAGRPPPPDAGDSPGLSSTRRLDRDGVAV